MYIGWQVIDRCQLKWYKYIASYVFLFVRLASRLHPLQLQLPNCIRFSCCMLPYCIRFSDCIRFRDCIRFSCCSPIVSASADAPRLCPLQLMLPDCVRFSSPTASASAAQPSSGRFQPLHEHSPSSRFFSTKVAHHYSLVQPPEHPTSVTHTHTNTWLKSLIRSSA